MKILVGKYIIRMYFSENNVNVYLETISLNKIKRTKIFLNL